MSIIFSYEIWNVYAIEFLVYVIRIHEDGPKIISILKIKFLYDSHTTTNRIAKILSIYLNLPKL